MEQVDWNKFVVLVSTPTVSMVVIATFPMANPPNRVQLIVVDKDAPLNLPSQLHDFPLGDYLKYLPKFTGECEIYVEEHLAAFYSYSNNQNVEHEDV